MRHNSTDRAEKSMKSYKRVRWRLHGLEARGRQGKYWKPKWKRNRSYVQKGHMVDARGDMSRVWWAGGTRGVRVSRQMSQIRWSNWWQ